jgi:hypothetical protein
MFCPYVIKPTHCSDTRFPGFISAPALEDNTCRHLLDWLQNGVPWKFHKTDFYTQLECDLLAAVPPSECRNLFTKTNLGILRTLMAKAFHVELARRQTVIAHKLLPSYEIGPHNDDPSPGMETHRLVIQLSDSSLKGGDLLIHGSRNAADVRASFPPVYNSCIAFALSSQSYHSVTTIVSGARYSVVFSFWSKESEPVLRFVGTRYYEAVESVLRGLGAERIPHSGADLLQHLVGTARLVDIWGCPRYLCLAGLLHSVYGTESFGDKLLSLSDRHQLQSIVDEKTEQLVYLFCHASRKTLYEALRNPDCPAYLLDPGTSEPLHVDTQDLIDLMVLDVANYVEQANRSKPGSPIEESFAQDLCTLAPLLPKAAREALCQLKML